MSPPNYLFAMDAVETRTYSGEMHPTCSAGIEGEAAFALEAAKRGYSIWFPIGHQPRADVIIWKPPDAPITVQVKKASVRTYGRARPFETRIMTRHSSCSDGDDGGEMSHRRYQRGDFDFLCSYIRERNSFVFYSIEDVIGKTKLIWEPGGHVMENNWYVIEK